MTHTSGVVGVVPQREALKQEMAGRVFWELEV